MPEQETRYLYTAQQYDPYTELYSLRARYYDPRQGRFLSRDTWAYNYQNPLELNRYVYTANNPVNYTDPSGHFIGRLISYVTQQIAQRPMGFAIGGLVGLAVSTFMGKYQWDRMLAGECGSIPDWARLPHAFSLFMQVQGSVGFMVGGIIGAMPLEIAASAMIAQSVVGGAMSIFDMLINGPNSCNIVNLISSIMSFGSGTFTLSGGLPIPVFAVNWVINTNGAVALSTTINTTSVAVSHVSPIPLAFFASMGGGGDDEDITLYRGMREGSGGNPEHGESGRTLGARENVDIPVDDNGMVSPGTGGMSVAPDSPTNLPPHRRPSNFGGTGRDPIWEFNLSDLPDSLNYVPDDVANPTHGVIEPATTMSYEEYLNALRSIGFTKTGN